ncbi:MAG TPA: adenosylcobinamide-GDP ribazoletransferase [Acidimicrobiia bacterium]|nr:adenosylcobinamide-GDP ribazoletransferase [Acidimicrobiia bacterium]
MRDALALLTTFGRRGGTLDARALPWFPVVGACVGACVGGVWWLAALVWPPVVAAVVAVIADLAVTGMLHVDGLADAADGLLVHADGDRRLAIMRSPEVGAFGVATVAAVLLARMSALDTLPPDVALVAVLAGTTRALVAAVPAWMPSARPSGMAASFVEGAPRWPCVGIVVAGALAAVTDGVRGVAAVVVATAAGVAVLVLARRRVGGFTGDVLGAAIYVGEAVGLLAAAARR